MYFCLLLCVVTSTFILNILSHPALQLCLRAFTIIPKPGRILRVMLFFRVLILSITCSSSQTICCDGIGRFSFYISLILFRCLKLLSQLFNDKGNAFTMHVTFLFQFLFSIGTIPPIHCCNITIDFLYVFVFFSSSMVVSRAVPVFLSVTSSTTFAFAKRSFLFTFTFKFYASKLWESILFFFQYILLSNQ